MTTDFGWQNAVHRAVERTVSVRRNGILLAALRWSIVAAAGMGSLGGRTAGAQSVILRPSPSATPAPAPDLRPDNQLATESRIIPGDVPLRVEVTRTVNLQAGQPFRGKLLEAIYGPDRLLLPKDTEVHGVIVSTPPTDRSTRLNAKLDGDFTPLREPVLRVTEIALAHGTTLPVEAEGGMRNASIVRFAARARPVSLAGQVKAMVHGQIQQVRDTIHDPHKGDRVKQMLYGQLPYHPQRVWAGSQFDAVLQGPLTIPEAAASPEMPHAAAVDVTSGRMLARLTGGISSESSKKGDPVVAVLAAPFCDAHGAVMLPTGTPLHGAVLQAKPSRFFGRSGRLRFSFRSVGQSAINNNRRIESTLQSIEGQKSANIELDAEGGALARPDPGRFLAPLVLAALAVASQDEDGGIARQGVTSNGFGLAARLVTMAAASRNASTGFAAYSFSKSIWRRWIAHGHAVSFPKNTELSIELNKH